MTVILLHDLVCFFLGSVDFRQVPSQDAFPPLFLLAFPSL